MVLWSVFNQLRLRQAGNNSQIGSRSALISTPSRTVNSLLELTLALSFLCFIFASPAANALSVAEGLALFNANSCASCHGVQPSAANNPARIAQAINPGINGSGTAGNMGNIVLSATDRQNISLYIGQSVIPVASNTNRTIAYQGNFSVDVLTLLGSGAASGGTPQDSGGITTSNPPHGSISISGQTITYTADAGYVGGDSFTYTITNPAGADTATITVTVNAPPAPVVNNTSRNVTFNSTNNALNLAANISNPVAAVNVTVAPIHGTFSVSGTTVTYTPTTNYSGADSFTYTATGPGGTSASSAVVSITVAPPGLPTVNNTSAAVAYNSTANAIDLTSSITSAGPTTVSVTANPAHGTYTVSGNVVTYTPTAAYFGADSFSYTATNAGGTSAAATVSITVSPPGAPTVANRNVSIASDSALNAIDLSASITSVAPTTVAVTVNPTHGTFSVGGNTVTYTPTAGYSGVDSFEYTATNAGGPSAAATVTITIQANPTTVSNATYEVALNTPKTFNLLTDGFITGTAITGVNIITPPKNGSAVVNGTTITYTPANDFFGPDSLVYQGFGAGVQSGNATVTLNITGRPDPTLNANTAAMMAAQMQTVQQFARSQISNFEQRFDNLHRMAAGSSYSNSSRQGMGIALQPATTLGNIEAQSAQLRVQDAKTAAIASSASTAAISPAQQPVMAYQNGQTMTDTDPGLVGLLNGPVGSNLLAALTSNSVNLAALNSALNNGNAPDAVQVWVAGNLKFGSINNGNNAGFTNFRTDGVTIGADKVVSDNLVLGVGLGYAFSKAKMVDDNSKTESNGMSVALYGSYQPIKKTFIDGLIGYGVTKFDSDRYVASVDDFARGSRRGDQVFASVAASYEFRDAGFMLAPYGRLDLSYNRLKEDTEKGAGLNALHYDDQTSRYTQLSAGLRAEVTHQTNFGLIIPRAKIEFQERMLSGSDATIQYADQLGTNYRLSGSKDQTSALVLGVGSNIILKNGVRLALDYQTLRSVGYETSQSVSFRLTKEFGVDNSQIPMVDTSQLAMPKFGVRVDMGYTFDDNINRTKISSEKETDRIFSINLNKSNNIQIRPNTRLVLSGFLGAERAYYFNGLDRVTGGGQAEFQYRTSGDFLAPTFGVFGRAATEQFNSVLRDGYRYTAGFTVRKPWTDRINTFAALSHIQKNAKEVTFDTKEISLRGNIDYMLSPDSTLYMTAEYRHGDILSTGAGSLENLDGSTARVRDDVFVRQNYITYRFGGDTVLATLGYNLALGPTDGLDFSWRRVESTPSSVPDYVAHKKSYVDNQYSIVYLVRF